jgi:hypothetical protein
MKQYKDLLVFTAVCILAMAGIVYFTTQLPPATITVNVAIPTSQTVWQHDTTGQASYMAVSGDTIFYLTWEADVAGNITANTLTGIPQGASFFSTSNPKTCQTSSGALTGGNIGDDLILLQFVDPHELPVQFSGIYHPGDPTFTVTQSPVSDTAFASTLTFHEATYLDFQTATNGANYNQQCGG